LRHEAQRSTNWATGTSYSGYFTTTIYI